MSASRVIFHFSALCKGGRTRPRRGASPWFPPLRTVCCRRSRRRDRPEHGAAHPCPACPLPCGNPGTALRRGERPESAGCCSLLRRPRRPLSRHHIALSPSNTHGPRDWQSRAPAHTLPPPDWLPARDCASSPASLCAPRARAGAPQPALAWPGARVPRWAMVPARQ